MRQKKRSFETFPFYDRTGMERRFEKMARKGWLIQSLSNYGYTYRRVEPQELHFSISYYPKASMFDPEPGENQQEFLDFCAHTGWKLACTWAQMQIFYNDRETPIPIETDPVLEVETIHEAMKKNFLWGQVAMLVLGLLQLYIQLLGLFGNIVAFLSSPLKVLTLGCWVLVILLTTADITVYFRWHKKAKEAAEQGEFLPSYSTAGFQKLTLAMLGAGLLWAVWNVLGSSNSLVKFLMPVMLVYITVLVGLTEGVKGLGKRLKFSRKVNLTVTMVTLFLLSFAMTGTITYLTASLTEQGFFNREEETYVHNGSTWVHYRDALPLTIGDFMEESCDYVCKLDTEQTPFLARQEAYQRPRYDEQDRADIPYLTYETVNVKVPALYGRCKQEMLEQFRRDERYVSIDPAPWGAGEAYQRIQEDGTATGQYLLCYGETLVEISFDWEVTKEQMAVVGQKLGS